MAVIKCKMCGGSLSYEAGLSVCECEYCGTKQTIPDTDDEKRLKLYERANKLRINNEFDKAAGVYESIVAEFQSEAEAYWGLVLCKYGIEYVDDPKTGKKIPTCHRSSFDAVFDDANFDLVMENADTVARSVYREEAKQIEEIRKGIIEVSSKEEPYDIFICYKETADDGQRTIDSVIAQDVYDELTEKGYRVFFSRITLEDKLGQEYEPYIFAALNSAKVMLVFGTQYDYLNAVWVKNEWSRFLQLMESGQKKTLIPCYKNIDAYDMPKEFAKLQAQDMGKVGAIQDLIRGINKIFGHNSESKIVSVREENTNSIFGNLRGYSEESLIQRIELFLEDKDWKSADSYCEQLLDINPQCSIAYLFKLMIQYEIPAKTELVNMDKPLDQEKMFQKALRFANDEFKNELEEYNNSIVERIAEEKYNSLINLYDSAKTEKQYMDLLASFEELGDYKNSADLRKECQEKALYSKYNTAVKIKYNAITEKDYYDAKALFDSLGEYKNSTEQSSECIELAEKLKQDSIYDNAVKLSQSNNINDVERSIVLFNSVSTWRDSEERKDITKKRLIELRYKEATSILKSVQERILVIDSSSAEVISNKWSEYEKCANELLRAANIFEGISEYENSKDSLNECKERANSLFAEANKGKQKEKDKKKRAIKIAAILTAIAIVIVILYIGVFGPLLEKELAYKKANELLEEGSYVDADTEFNKLGDYKDSQDLSKEAMYRLAEKHYENGRNEDAIKIWKELGDYSDATDRIKEVEDVINEKAYVAAEELLANKKYKEAALAFQDLGDYKDSSDRIVECVEIEYNAAVEAVSRGEYEEAIRLYGEIVGYEDAEEKQIETCYDYANMLLKNKEYEKSVEYFQKCKDYKDADQLILDAQYEYVLKNKNHSEKTFSYTNALVKAKYPGAQEIYDELFTWKVDVSINNGASMVYYSDKTEVEYKITGGEPGKSIKIAEVVTYPNGEIEKDDWITVKVDESHGFYWENGVMQGGGFVGKTLKVEIVSEWGTVLGEASIVVTN